jgi:hypothetical protein
MKFPTFNDIRFRADDYGYVGNYPFQNGYLISIIAGESRYSTPRKKLPSSTEYTSYEIAIMDEDGNFVTNILPSISHSDDVVWGFVEITDINWAMALVSCLPPKQNNGMTKEEIPGFEGTLDQLSKLKIR